MTAPRFCPSCGTARIDGARFCGGCGADLRALGGRPEPDRAFAVPTARTGHEDLVASTHGGRIRPSREVFVVLGAILLVATFVLGGLSFALRPALPGVSASNGGTTVLGPSSSTAPTTAAPGETARPALAFATPEDAIRAYMAGIAAGDLNAALAASAIEEPAKALDFEAYLDRVAIYTPDMNIAPGQYPFFSAVNAAENAAAICRSAEMMVYGLIGSESVSTAVTIAPPPDRVGAFVASVDPAKVADLRLRSIGTPIDGTRMDRSSGTLVGASDVAERLALFATHGRAFYVRFNLLRYPSGWKVWQQIAGDMSGLSPTATTEAGFAALVSGGTTEDSRPAAPSPTGTAAVSGPGYASPEEAVDAFLSAVARGNATALLAATDVDPLAEHFDFAAYTEYFGILPALDLPPRNYPFFAAALRLNAESGILTQAKFLAFSLLTDEPLDNTNGIAGLTPDRVRALVQALDPAPLQGLQVQRIGTPVQMAAHPFTSGYLASYGATDATERLALFSVNGRTYWKGFKLLRYGDRWWVRGTGSHLAGDANFGGAMPTTAAEFAALAAGG